jgi:hypothetical protein
MFINPLSVLIAALIGLAITIYWYSHYLYGARWKEIMGDGWQEGVTKYTPRQALLIEGLLTLATAYVLSNLSTALSIHGPLMAVRLGFWVWLGFQVTTLFSSVIFENRPMKLFYIVAGQRLVTTLAMALVVGIWH